MEKSASLIPILLGVVIFVIITINRGFWFAMFVFLCLIFVLYQIRYEVKVAIQELKKEGGL